MDTVKSSIDLDLLTILVCSLAIGVALTKSGAASFIVVNLFGYLFEYPNWVGLVALFFLTLMLTAMITNVAAVSIMFPIALELGNINNENLTPYFVAIAFAASADFITPIGYQTNLMVMGPGNYRFKDYFKIGFPLTIIYTIISLFYITLYYNL